MPFDGVRSGPLVCTDHSVRMILRDIKIASRRAIRKPKDLSDRCDACWSAATPVLAERQASFRLSNGPVEHLSYLDVPRCEHLPGRGVHDGRVRSPYGTRGDKLWIRETCRELEDGSFDYRADHSDEEAYQLRPWKNVRFVPKRSARIWLEVLEVRAEPVQAITPDDVVREGICLEDTSDDPVEAFACLWDKINGRRDDGALAWARNPWVWRILFRRITH